MGEAFGSGRQQRPVRSKKRTLKFKSRCRRSNNYRFETKVSRNAFWNIWPDPAGRRNPGRDQGQARKHAACDPAFEGCYKHMNTKEIYLRLDHLWNRLESIAPEMRGEDDVQESQALKEILRVLEQKMADEDGEENYWTVREKANEIIEAQMSAIIKGLKEKTDPRP